MPLDAQWAEMAHDFRLLEMVVPDEMDVRPVQRGDVTPGRVRRGLPAPRQLRRRGGQICGIPDDDRVDHQG